MTMYADEHLQKLAEEHRRLAESRGFTIDFQREQEKKSNTISHRQIAPATSEKYDRAFTNWAIWRLTRNEPASTSFTNDDPDPSPQLLKNFAENYIVTRKVLPSQQSTCDNFTCFTSMWERETSRSLPIEVKKDVLNFIRTDLTSKYGLPSKSRERHLVTAGDLDYLLHRLFGHDNHDYVHERARVQIASSLSIFSGSAARAGSVVESSSYRSSNECLYYRNLTFNLKWSNKTGGLKRWVVIDPEFLKGFRYRDDKEIPKTWFREHPVLGKNFIFWIIVHGIADGAFKGISSVDEILQKRPPKGRESWTLNWTDNAKNLPFFRMVTPQGPSMAKALTASSLRHHLTSLAMRDGFRDRLRVHGIRGAVANVIDPNASAATRSQALDHESQDTYLKYQSPLKSLDIFALYHDLEPDYECRDMERSMAHHRDPNVPLRLDAASVADFETNEDVISINQRIADLTKQISGLPGEHTDLVTERSKLYTKKTKILRKKHSEFITQWWDSSYDEYIAGSDFTERDTTRLSDIYHKYTPERARLQENLFTKVSIDSDIGRQCLRDAVSLCTSHERVVYYPGMEPVDGKCPVCCKQMSSLEKQGRSKHILQCRRRSLNAAPYQQRYKNGKRAHRRAHRDFLQFCYLCAQFIYKEPDWINHCESHLENLQPRCGLLTFRYTLVSPGFCPFCLGDNSKRADDRFQQWLTKSTLLNHIDQHMETLSTKAEVSCPHPYCSYRQYAGACALRRHFFDAHSVDEPRTNCVSRKRKWIDYSVDVKLNQGDPEIKDKANTSEETLSATEHDGISVSHPVLVD